MPLPPSSRRTANLPEAPRRSSKVRGAIALAYQAGVSERWI
jgi:hypothetical protein